MSPLPHNSQNVPAERTPLQIIQFLNKLYFNPHMFRLALLLILFLASFKGIGQHEKKTVFGFKGGINRSVVNGIEPDGTKTGYVGIELYGSFFADTELLDKWNLENEILFSYTDDYHFIEIPLHMKYGFHKNWFALAGPKLDFIADNDNDPFESNYRFKNFGVSGEVGIQYHFVKRFLVEMRYSKSFTRQIDDLALDIFEGKRNTLRFGLGIKF